MAEAHEENAVGCVSDVAVTNSWAMLSMWSETMATGTVIRPRGQEVREIEDYQISVDPRYPFQSFAERNYNYDYFKKEMLWKLTGNKFDESIKEHAKMWESVQNPDGTFNSNYGQYWFGEQKGMWSVIEELVRDVDSRQAVIPMLSREHMSPQTVDKVCTECVGFRIRNDKLNMSVHMRSSDQVFGLGTDIPTFAFLQQLIFGVLTLNRPNLEIGTLTITAMSSHIYSRHYAMLEKVIRQGVTGYSPIEMPRITGAAEALFIVASKGKHPENGVPDSYPLAKWLFERRA